MTQRIGLVSLVVDDYDDALAFFVGKLGMARWLSSKISTATSGICSNPTMLDPGHDRLAHTKLLDPVRHSHLTADKRVYVALVLRCISRARGLASGKRLHASCWYDPGVVV